MHNKCLWRFLVIAAALVVLGVLVVAGTWQSETCLGVELIEPEQAATYTESFILNAAASLQYNGEQAPVDVVTSTIYLAIQPDKTASELAGRLECEPPIGQLFFVRDDAFDDMAEAVAQGHVFTLLATDGAQGCMRYNVVFTTLPVVALSASGGDGENIYGMIRAWDPYNEVGGVTQPIGENARWHLRGYTSQSTAKKSWKISVCKEDGTAQNVNLAGLGSDDDWMLNPMSMDDTRVRENLLMTLWNQIAAQSDWDLQSSSGKYVEVLINGEYRGLYLLQRRVDRKLLGLEDELLFKGRSSEALDTAMDVYKIVYSPLNMALSYEAMSGVWQDVTTWDVNNYVDMCLFIQFGALADNCIHKNMFYLLQAQGDGYVCSMIPWDVDMAFGTTWVDGVGFQYGGDRMLTYMPKRRGYDDMLALHPELEEQLSTRWFELRQGVFSWENIQSTLQETLQTIYDSGAYEREFQTWKPRYEGQDTHEVLEQWIQDRLQWCDEYYANK